MALKYFCSIFFHNLLQRKSYCLKYHISAFCGYVEVECPKRPRALPVVNHWRVAPCDARAAARNSNERTRQWNQIACIPFSSRGCYNIHERRLHGAYQRYQYTYLSSANFPIRGTWSPVIVRAVSNSTRGYCAAIYRRVLSLPSRNDFCSRSPLNCSPRLSY